MYTSREREQDLLVYYTIKIISLLKIFKYDLSYSRLVNVEKNEIKKKSRRFQRPII